METFKFILILSLIFGLVVVYPIMVIFQKRKEQKRILQERRKIDEILNNREIICTEYQYQTEWKKKIAEYRRAKPKVEFKETTFKDIKRYEKESKEKEFIKLWEESDK